ncbi:polysaccharide deacetylase family protein [Streptomyces hokutonensis]|uniref:polysaccharide deacetylase family protein n=1 Tax=Streptomyces hokutonensis TaxID=1306990 RepID=UPI003821AF00
MRANDRALIRGGLTVARTIPTGLPACANSPCSCRSSCSAGSNGAAAQGGTSSSTPATIVDPAKIKGLTIVNDSGNDRSYPWAPTYRAVPGAEVATATMKEDDEGYLLKYLAQYKARVTFFTVGQNVAAHPELVRAEAKAGHEVGNHSWNHPDLTRLTTAQIRLQLERTSAAIKAATGKPPTLFRPPYGAINAQVKAATTMSPVLRTRGHRGLEVAQRAHGRPDRHQRGRTQRRRPDAQHPPHVGGRRTRDPEGADRQRLPLRDGQPPACHALAYPAGRPPRSAGSSG